MPDISTLNGVDVGDVASMNGSDSGDCASVNGQVWPNLAGTLWSWGVGGSGNLGQSTAAGPGGHGGGADHSVSVPIQVGTDTDWSKISTNTPGTSTIAIKTDGTIWSWGVGANGVHGHGDIINRSSPVQLGTSTNWTAAGGGTHANAIIGGGKLYVMGDNQAGALGQGTSNIEGSVSSPIQVGTDTNWSKVSGGVRSFVALKTDGTLWGWGAQQFGTIGDNTTRSRSVPVQVGTATNWTQIAANNHLTGAINADGELYMWGKGGYGATGQGDKINRSVPTQVGTDTDWTELSIGYANVLAVKGGAVYVWGLARGGQLGNNTNGNTAHVSSPLQVGTDTDFVHVSMANATAKAIKTDGTIFNWGLNTEGQLGRGDVVNRSTPTQMGTDENWGSVGAGFSSGFYSHFQVKV